VRKLVNPCNLVLSAHQWSEDAGRNVPGLSRQSEIDLWVTMRENSGLVGSTVELKESKSSCGSAFLSFVYRRSPEQLAHK